MENNGEIRIHTDSNKKSRNIGMYLVVGFALFSMLFGAGNLIFPPEIGLSGGTAWWQGYTAYFLADAALGICSVFAMLKVDGDPNRLTGTVGRTGSLIINLACIICIGPLLAIPRNAAVTFEMGAAPLLGIDPGNAIARLIFSVLFFAVVVVLTIRPSKVIDILGKYLTPVLVVAITVLIIVGVINPAAPAGSRLSETLFRDGIYNGYQTLDVMAGLFFSILVIDAIRGKQGEGTGANAAGASGAAEAAFSTSGAGGTAVGEKSNAAAGEKKAAARAALLAGGLLCFVYGGLTYLGATTGSQWTDAYLNGEINQAGLLINIAQALLGKVGVGVLSIIVALACLTTAIGLTSAAAEYFSGLLGGRHYAAMILLVSGVSLGLSNFGLSTIIGIAAPVLMLFYPTVMFLTMATLFRGKLRKQNIYRLGAGVSFLISALTVLADTCGIGACGFIHQLPLDAYGFNWLIPAVIAAVIGYFLPGGEIEE